MTCHGPSEGDYSGMELPPFSVHHFFNNEKKKEKTQDLNLNKGLPLALKFHLKRPLVLTCPIGDSLQDRLTHKHVSYSF